jgi:hypothetical protein
VGFGPTTYSLLRPKKHLFSLASTLPFQFPFLFPQGFFFSEKKKVERKAVSHRRLSLYLPNPLPCKANPFSFSEGLFLFWEKKKVSRLSYGPI